MQRTIMWGDTTQVYDSGAHQGSTPYVKPFIKYSFGLQNIPRTKQSSLHAFYANVTRGNVRPFLFQDPYDYLVNGITVAASGVSSFFVRTAEGYPVIPVSGSLLIRDTRSGNLTQGTHYSFNGVTGVFSVHVSISSLWVASCSYFRKCVFESYNESSKLWEMFEGNVAFREISLP
jgi:hypothetical protein